MKNLLLALCLLAPSLSVNAEVKPAPAKPIIVVAVVKVKPGTEGAFRDNATRVVSPTLAEAGNAGYDFYQSVTEPTHFVTYEHWKSQADLDKHMQSPHMQEFFKAVGGFFEAGYPQIQSFAE